MSVTPSVESNDYVALIEIMTAPLTLLHLKHMEWRFWNWTLSLFCIINFSLQIAKFILFDFTSPTPPGHCRWLPPEPESAGGLLMLAGSSFFPLSPIAAEQRSTDCWGSLFEIVGL